MTKSFDVFLSHNSKDKPAVRVLAEALRARGLNVWLDEWELVPGRPWQEALEEIIEITRSAAVLVGKDGLGPWQDKEMRGCLSEFVDRKLPVIPVLLPVAPDVPRLPIFLKGFTWVDLRGGLTGEGIDRLQWGITGKRPDRSKPPATPTAAPEAMAAAEAQPASAVRPMLPEVEAPAAVSQEQPIQKARPRWGYSATGTGRWKKVGWGVGVVAVAVLWTVAGSHLSPVAWKQLPQPGEQEVSSTLSPASKVGAPSPALVQPTEPKAGTTTDGPLGMRLRYVPSGVYMTGSPVSEAGRYRNEIQHNVKLTRGVWLGETEITRAQWSRLMSRQHLSWEACGPDCPVDFVSWYEAVEFANRLSDREGLERCYRLVDCKATSESAIKHACKSAAFVGLGCLGYRLATEAEWEVAARAGTTTAIYTGGLTLQRHTGGVAFQQYDKAPELDPIAWYFDNSAVTYADSSLLENRGIHPVGQKQANTWGFHDLLGNVEEWTNDWHGEYPTGLVLDPVGPPSGSTRVRRGGSCFSGASHVRTAYRGSKEPSQRLLFLGFRLARSHDSRPSGRNPGPP